MTITLFGSPFTKQRRICISRSDRPLAAVGRTAGAGAVLGLPFVAVHAEVVEDGGQSFGDAAVDLRGQLVG